MSTTTRLVIAAVLIALIYGWVVITRRGLEPPDIELPRRPAADLPLTLGPWVGRDAELDPQVFVAIAAAQVINRVYQDAGGQVISMNCGVFGNYPEAISHHPMICYPANGYDLVEEKQIQLTLDDGTRVSMPLLVFERQGNRILVMCWYQMGNELFFNRAGLGTTRMAFRGEKVWPAAVKVLLQTTASDVRQAQDGLADFATRVYEWTRDMQ